MKKLLLLSILCIAVATPVFAQEAAGSKRELVLKFIEVFGTKAAMEDNLKEMLASLPEDEPDSKKLRESIKVDEIIERLIPVYEKQFSTADLNAYIAFYSSPEGQKLVRGIPTIMRESVDVSTQYFQEKFPEMADEQ